MGSSADDHGTMVVALQIRCANLPAAHGPVDPICLLFLDGDQPPGPALLGVRAVIVESFERIHRSNLVGMGVLPLQFLDGENSDSHGLDGTETISITGLAESYTSGDPVGSTVKVTATEKDGSSKSFDVRVRIDTPAEAEYYRHGGILVYVLRRLAKA